MTFINWSDSEEMVGLLADYVADEKRDAQNDPERASFLSELSAELADLARVAAEMPVDELIDRLRALKDSPGEPVWQHVEDCIRELERIGSTA
jgi:hypothetical protein